MIEYTVEVFTEKGWEISASTHNLDTAFTIFKHELTRGDARLSSYTPAELISGAGRSGDHE